MRLGTNSETSISLLAFLIMRGQKFTLNLDADNFDFQLQDDEPDYSTSTFNVVKEIKEREPTAPPPAPKLKSKSGFPEHGTRKISAFKRTQAEKQQDAPSTRNLTRNEPSDRAIINQIGKKYGIDSEAKEKADINEENKQRLAQMSVEDIEQARSELLSNLNPTLIERLLRRANIEEDEQGQDWDQDPVNENKSADEQTGGRPETKEVSRKKVSFEEQDEKETIKSQASDISGGDIPLVPAGAHFPIPPRDPSSYKSLDPTSATFLSDLRTNYFPDTPHDPSQLTWLQDPTEEETSQSAYAPTQTSYAPSDIRFDFTGRLLPPTESAAIPVDKGLHHHGEAPESAGYTIPELALLVRSTLPNQRCIAYQMLGRILYRLGRGDFGPRGTELNEGLWGCIEHERPVEVMMAEANRTGGHMSAKAYATEALWLWRKGGGGDRGVLKPGEKIAK